MRSRHPLLRAHAEIRDFATSARASDSELYPLSGAFLRELGRELAGALQQDLVRLVVLEQTRRVARRDLERRELIEVGSLRDR